MRSGHAGHLLDGVNEARSHKELLNRSFFSIRLRKPANQRLTLKDQFSAHITS